MGSPVVTITPDAASQQPVTITPDAAPSGLQLSNPSTVPNARIRNMPDPAAGETSPLSALYHGAKIGATLASIPAATELSPSQFIGSLVGGGLGSKAGNLVAKASGASPLGQEAAGDVGGMIGGLYGANRMSSEVEQFIGNLKARASGQAGSMAQSISLPGIKPTKASLVDPYREQILPQMTPGTSTTIQAHGYNPQANEAFIHFKSGDVYRYQGVPEEVYDQFANADSQGSFHANNIKGRYVTDKVGKVKPTR